MLIDRQHRRLGDLVAGTVLVREERVDLSRYEAASGTSRDVDTVEVATSFLARFDELEPAARLRIGRTLAARLGLPADEATTAEALRDAVRLKLGAG
jgi:sRNA-binding protein